MERALTVLWWLAVTASPGAAQSLRLAKGGDGAAQGAVLHIEQAPAGATQAGLDGDKPVPLFGGGAGLVPVRYDARPGMRRLSAMDAAGTVLESVAVEVRQVAFPVQNITASPGMKALRPLPGEMAAMRALHGTVTDERHWEEIFASPVPGCVNSPFGVTRLHNGKPSGNYHRGLDQRGAKGQVVVAAASGTVKVASLFRLHGGTVGIDHGQGVTSHYLHMSKIQVKPGARVSQGDPIGEVGATGFATGPHLHWGLYIHTVPVNPQLWLRGVHRCR